MKFDFHCGQFRNQNTDFKDKNHPVNRNNFHLIYRNAVTMLLNGTYDLFYAVSGGLPESPGVSYECLGVSYELPGVSSESLGGFYETSGEDDKNCAA
jgi:hypothetical protein